MSRHSRLSVPMTRSAMALAFRRVHRSQNRLDPDPSSACDEVPAIATVAVSDEEPWLLIPGGRLDHLLPVGHENLIRRIREARR